MVLLSRALKPFCVFLIVVIGGCVVADKLGLSRKSVRFSHQIHVTDEEIDCVDCHLKAEDEAEAGLPRMKQCMLCHEGVDEDLPVAKRPMTIYGKKPVWTSAADIPGEVKFSHATHYEADVECAECHQGIEKNTRITKAVRVDMDACLKCHAAKKVAAKCETCHTRIREDQEPDSHRHNWKKYHGQIVRAETGATGDNCALCHTEATCTKCHRDEAPRNHNNHWRHRGHGLTAQMDRDNCSVCHRSDFCDRCHRETEPRNHVGAWGSPRNRHCTSCHFPLSGEGCVTCHKSTPSHAQATALPTNNAHATATDANCRTCHVSALRIGHPDNGESCRICHQ